MKKIGRDQIISSSVRRVWAMAHDLVIKPNTSSLKHFFFLILEGFILFLCGSTHLCDGYKSNQPAVVWVCASLYWTPALTYASRQIMERWQFFAIDCDATTLGTRGKWSGRRIYHIWRFIISTRQVSNFFLEC